MNSSMNSPAGQQSTGTAMHPPTAAITAARAAVNEAAGKAGLEAVQTVMGDLEDLKFGVDPADFCDSIPGFRESMGNDSVSSSQVHALLNLFATEAKGEVRCAAEAVENRVYTVLAAKDASVNDLKRTADLLQQDKDDALRMLKRQKMNPANISGSEKQFNAKKEWYDKILGLLYDPKFVNLLPGDIAHTGTDEAQYADLLLQETASEEDEKSMVRLDARIKIKEQRLKSLRLQLAKLVSPTVTQVQLDKTKPTAFPLDKYAGVANQTEWRTIVCAWIKQPGNLNKYLEIAGDITMMYSAWDPATGYYRSTGLKMVPPMWWLGAQQQADPVGYLRATLSQHLFEEIVTLGATHKAAYLAFRTGVNVGYEGTTSIPWIENDGLRTIHLGLLHLKNVRTGDILKMEESLRRLHFKFTGDTKLETAMKETESALRKAAEMNVVPAWFDVGQPIYTAIEFNCSYFYAKAASAFSDGLLSKGFDQHDCTATIDLMFDQLKNKINEATRHEDTVEKGHRKKGPHLEAMKAVVKGAKTVKSETYKGLLEHQQKEIHTFLAANAAKLDWGSKKSGKVVHALSMQLSTGQELSLPDCAKVKPAAPQGKRKRETDGGSTGQQKKGCQVKGCKWGTPWSKARGKYEMFCLAHFKELNDGVTLQLESGKEWVPREQFKPDAKAGKGGKGSKGGKGNKGSKGKTGKTNAFTVKVKDKGSDDVREMVIDKDVVTTILGLQAGTVTKVADAASAEISDEQARAALNQLLDFSSP